MTIQIDAPASATDRAVVEIQAHSAKMLSLINATQRDFAIPRGLAEQLLAPSITIPQCLAENIWSAKSLAGSIARHHQPALSNRIQATIRETQAMAKRFEAVAAPILAQHRRLEQSISELMTPIRSATIAAQLTLARSVVGFGGGPSLPYATVVRVTSKAARTVDFARERLRNRRRRVSDVRHRVELIVNLPNGELIQVSKMSATEDGLIRVIGADVDGFLRERFLAPEVIQYEIVTMKVPPPGAQLTVVK